MPVKFFPSWRPSLPDHRDYLYQVPAHVAAALPAHVDQSRPAVPAPFEPPIDQADLGSCGPTTVSKDLIFSALRQQKVPTCPIPSRLFIYYNTRLLMGTAEGDPSRYLNMDSGVDNRSLMKALAKYGWCDEADLPYVTSKFARKPTAAQYRKAKPRAILQYESVAQQIAVMKGAVANGDTFLLGLTVYEPMLSDAVAKTGVVPMPTRKDKIAGGHDILIVGYDDATQMFKFQNHWWLSKTRPWGDKGYGYLPYAYAISPKLAGDFWTATSSGLIVKK